MSATPLQPQIVNAYKADLVENYCGTAAITIVGYELLITLQREYELVWRYPWSGATWLFLANRYLLLTTLVTEMVPDSAAMLQSPFGMARECGVAATEHCHGQYGLSIVLAWQLNKYSLQCFRRCESLHYWVYQTAKTTYYYVDDPVLGSSCYSFSLVSLSASFYRKRYMDSMTELLTRCVVTLASSLCMIASDAIAIIVTWTKTYRHVREASSAGISIGFGATLLRYGMTSNLSMECAADRQSCEGTLYFVVMLFVGLALALTILIDCVPFIHQPPLQTTGPVILILPNVIISRFLMNLRRVNTQTADSGARSSRFSVPNFRMPNLRSIIGNLGEPLAAGEEEQLDAEASEDGARIQDFEKDRLEGTLDVPDVGSPGGVEEVPRDCTGFTEDINSNDCRP
ncbi:hypothetical protein NM688_g7995 [Phlebia brevispora]|uniref:Uncharacterized protein n=1 Tax=Phlebia brevispora TaxID=194682 RepID=A0ACC1RYR1_9APHY|nr:hypothetical protein NM688_g7995 [Phlebia brevispora]